MRKFPLSLALVLSMPLASGLPAADVFFDFDADPNQEWTEATNWAGDVQPGTADRATINNGLSGLITTDVGTINSLRLGANGGPGNGNGTLTIDGGVLTINDTGGTGADVRLGESNLLGTLILINGGTLNAQNGGADGQFYLGTTGSGSGVVDVQNGTIDADRGFYVGGDSTNNDRVNTTGLITLGDGTGSADATLEVNGGNTEVGYGGMGTMILNSDGVLNQNTNNLVIAQGGSSVGEFIMNGGAVNIHAGGDVNMNSGTQTFTINDGTLNSRAFNQNILAGKTSITNLNGGTVNLIQDFVDRDGTSFVNYNGAQVIVGGNDFTSEFLTVGSDSAVSTNVTMNLVAAAAALGDLQSARVEIKRNLTLANTGVTATMNIDNGTVDLVGSLIDGGGTSALNVGASSTGTLRISGMNPTAAVGSRIDSFSIGANGTLQLRPNAFGINTIETTDATLTGGTLSIDTGSLVAGPNNTNDLESVWVAGNGAWVTGNNEWSRGDPAGYTIGADTNMTVIDSTNPVTGTVSLATAGWTLQDDGTSTGQVVISNDAAIDVGVRRAVLTGNGSTVEITRDTDLIIGNFSGSGSVGPADAARLQILPDANLTVGSSGTNRNVYVGGGGPANAEQGVIDQSGDVTIFGDLFFGQDAGGSDDGGTWNVFNGATLTVSGDIREQAAATDGAQFYIRGGSVDVGGDIIVQRFDVAGGGSQTTDFTLNPGQLVRSTGTTQIGGASRGRVYLNDSGSVLNAANMIIGFGNNTRDSRLEVSAGLAGTSNGGLTLGDNTNSNTGARIVVNGTGTVRVSQNGNINNPASGNADLNVKEGRTLEVSVRDSGTLDIGRNFLLHNSTATAGGTHQLTVNVEDSATLNVVGNLDYRAGASTVNISGGTVSIGQDVLLDGGAGVFRVEGANPTITVGQNFTQGATQGLEFSIGANGLAPIQVGSVGLIDLAGTIDVDTSLLTDATAVSGFVTTWSTGNGTWTTSDAEWLTPANAMINPDGITVTNGSRFTAFDASSGAAFTSNTPTVNTADWSFDNTADTSKGDLVYSGADIVGLPLQAVLDDIVNGGPLTITRATDLQIAPVVGAAASGLTIEDDVTLDITDGVTDPNLIVGSATEEGLVNQNGGTVNIDGALVFGTGANTFGGIYNLNGGSLNVGGDVIEGSVGGGVDDTVDEAQLYINGGTLNVTGANINVQSLRVGQAAGSNATVTLTDKTVASSGESRVGDQDGAVGVLNLLGTTDFTSGTALSIGAASGSDGTLNVGDGTDSPALSTGGTNDIEIGPSGTGRLNFLSGTINANGGIDIAANSGGVGFLTVGDGTSNPILNVSNGNLETAVGGTGTVTWNSGTLNQTTNNLIVGQNGSSNATFIFKDGLIDLENQLRMNNGTGLFEQQGGVVNVGTTLDMQNGGVTTNDFTYRMSGGTLNVGDRAAGNLVVGNSNNAVAQARFEHTAGDINVRSIFYVGNDSTGTFSFDNAANTVNVGWDYDSVTPGITLQSRLTVGDNSPADGSQMDFQRGSLNIGGGIAAGWNDGADGSIVIGTNGGTDTDTTVRAGIVGTDGGSESRIGFNGTGSLTLESGKFYQENQDLLVANDEDALGFVTVNGGELWVGFDQATETSNGTSALRVGNGNSQIDVNGGTVNVATSVELTPDTSGLSRLNIDGGTLNVGTEINYGSFGDDVISLSSGTLNFTDPAGGTINVSNARDAFTFTGGTLQNLGTFNGYDPTAAPEVANIGSNPSDALLINGSEAGFGAGKVGNGLTLGNDLSANDAVSFSDDRFGNPRAFSVSIWFNRSQQNNGSTTNHGVNNVLVAQSSSPTNDNFEIGTENNFVELYIDTNGAGADNPPGDSLRVDTTGVGGIANGAWNHLVVTYDGDAATDRLNLYLNGQAVTGYDKDAFTGVLQSAAGTTNPDSPFTLGIARPDSNNWGDFSGTLDEFASWNLAISASDVADLYNGGSGSNSAAILGSASLYAPLENQLAGNLETFNQGGGVFAPGLAAGTLADQVGASTINANFDFTGGVWDIDLVSDGAISNDFIDVNGTLSLGGTSLLDLALLDFSNLGINDVFVIGEYDVLSGTFGSVDFSELDSALSADWKVDYNYMGGNQIAILVPEPSRAVLLGFGLLALVLRRRR